MRFIFLLLLIIVFALGGFFMFRATSHVSMQQQALTIHGIQFIADVARTPNEQDRGLSGRTSILADHGMFFPFTEPGLHGFWMKEMLFPIDIIWIANNHVIGFVERVIPDDRPDRVTYYPSAPVDAVLEVAAGTVARVGIQTGDAVQ